jgi:hypothetical protein
MVRVQALAAELGMALNRQRPPSAKRYSGAARSMHVAMAGTERPRAERIRNSECLRPCKYGAKFASFRLRQGHGTIAANVLAAPTWGCDPFKTRRGGNQ